MKRLLILSLLLTGCSTTVPVTRTFPEVPSELTVPCPDLKLIPDTDKLSEVITVVAHNYSTYKECQVTTEMWNKWYQDQKKNFNEVK